MLLIDFIPYIAELKKVISAAKTFITFDPAQYHTGLFISSAEAVNESLEKAAVMSRNALEQLRNNDEKQSKVGPVLPYMSISGSVEIIRNSWLHIRLHTLLPHCRYQSPQYLSDTITRLMDKYAADRGGIPRYEKAFMIIDEHCDINSRNVFDQDNKGWKAIPNALKGRVFPDDDQFSLSVAMVSTVSEKPLCDIYIIGENDAGSFFFLREKGMLHM
jgi:hypothetical protein